MHLNGTAVAGGQDICDKFSNYFQSSFLLNTQTISGGYRNCYSNSLSLNNIEISEGEISKYLHSLDCNKGAGPDGLPPLFLKKCARVLCKPLCIIYNKSLQTCTFPTKWKMAHITPIHKSGCLQDITNYRPISILSAAGKILEKIVQNTLYCHVKHLLHNNQHGFLPHKSTASNLVKYVTDLSDVLDKGGEVHSIYTDFKKAFDLVHHDILLYKIEHMGIHGSLLRWCESYLKNRSQLVSVHGFKSAPALVSSGVPQGSHLGPIFFLIFVNDISHVIKSNFLMYADDLKIYRAIDSLDDTQLLQDDLHRIHQWCAESGMILNTNKCCHIRFTRRRIPLALTYYIDQVPLSEVTSVRDLGVIIDTTLSFRGHFDAIINKASRLTGFVSRQMKVFKEPKISILIYNCLVRSILEYCSPVWSPGYQIHSDRLERIQKRFLYYITYNSKKCEQLFTYDSRVDHYNMTTLQKRRKILDLMFLFKLIHGAIDAPDILESLHFTIPRPGSRLLNRKTFSLPYCKTNLGQHSPLYRICSLYNSIRFKFDLFSGSVVSARKCIKEYYMNCNK